MEKTIEPNYKKNIGMILLISLAGMTVYLLPYLRYYYYDAMLSYLNINDMQMGVLGSVYGAFAIVGYCLGGWVADRFQLKYIVPGSLIVTGLLGFLHLTRPAYPVLLVIYGIWGISTILTFWNPLMKALRMMSRPDEQGRGYALFDVGRGVLNFAIGIGCVALFTKLVTIVGDITGMTILYLIYSAFTLVVGVITYFVFRGLPDTRSQGKSKDSNFWKNVLKVLRMPNTWLLIIAMFMSYGVIISYFYVIPFCTESLGLSAAIASVLGYCANGFRIVGCYVGGQIGDRKGLSATYAGAMALMIVGYLGIILMPKGGGSAAGLIVVFIAIICMSQYAAEAFHYSVLEEGDYPLEIMGAATFVITPLGYLGETIFPLINGAILQNIGGTQAYDVMFGMFCVLLAIGIAALLLFRVRTKDRRKELAALRAKNK